jgi:hypothetical protein
MEFCYISQLINQLIINQSINFIRPNELQQQIYNNIYKAGYQKSQGSSQLVAHDKYY